MTIVVKYLETEILIKKLVKLLCRSPQNGKPLYKNIEKIAIFKSIFSQLRIVYILECEKEKTRKTGSIAINYYTTGKVTTQVLLTQGLEVYSITLQNVSSASFRVNKSFFTTFISHFLLVII